MPTARAARDPLTTSIYNKPCPPSSPAPDPESPFGGPFAECWIQGYASLMPYQVEGTLPDKVGSKSLCGHSGTMFPAETF